MSADPTMRRRLAIAVAVIGLLAVGVAQSLPNRHRMETDLTRRSLQALHADGLSDVDVTFVGRDGTVRVRSAADGDRALAIVRAQRGVRVVHVVAERRIQVPPAVPPTVRLALDGGRAVLDGTVSSPAVRDALVQAATAALGPGTVTDHLVVDPAVGDAALAGLGSVLSAVGRDATVVLDLRNGVLTLTGTVSSPAAREAALAAGIAAVGGPSAVVDRLVVVPPDATGQPVQTQLAALPTVTFETASAVLTPDGRSVVARVAAILSANPAVRVRIEGHTDDAGTPQANLTLSLARAQAVLDALREQGIAADRLTVAGFGQTRPKVPNTTEANKAINRRVEFVVVG